MSNTSRGWIGLIVGLVVGMSIGAAVAVPAAQQYLVNIMSWPENLNVTLTNPPSLPPDADGDGVPDDVDAFPTNPMWSVNVLIFQGSLQGPGELRIPIQSDRIVDLMINSTTTVNYIEYYLIPDQSCGVFLWTPNTPGFVMPYRLTAGLLHRQPSDDPRRARDGHQLQRVAPDHGLRPYLGRLPIQ